MSNALSIAPFLNGSFDGFFSLLTLHQLSKTKGDNVLRTLVDPFKEKSNIKLSETEYSLLNQYHISNDLIHNYYMRNQNLYYIVGKYAELIRILNHLELRANPNLQNLLVFVTETSKLDTPLASHARSFFLSTVPEKYHHNFIYLDNLTLREMKELLSTYIVDRPEKESLIPLNQKDKPYGLIMSNYQKLNEEQFEKCILSLRGLESLWIISDSENASSLKEAFAKIDNSKITVKNVYIQADPTSFYDLAGFIQSDNCKVCCVLNDNEYYKFR